MIWSIILLFMKGFQRSNEDLSITAQKPNSTGSGVYLTELVKEYALLSHEQAVVAGVYREDEVELPDGGGFLPRLLM